MFALISGIIAVIAATWYAIYVLFFANRGSTTVNTCGNHLFQEGDTINLVGSTMEGKYRVVKVNGEQLSIKPRNWFG